MKKAFTLVELIVVTSIIILVSFVSISSFFNFAEKQAINTKIMLFEDEIKEFDNKIKNKEIFDYKLELRKGQDKYKIVENIFEQDKYISINSTSGIGKIILENFTPSDKFSLKIYKGEKLISFKSEIEDYNLLIDDKYDYKITGYLSGVTLKELNSIYIKNFDKDEKKIILHKLTDTKSPESNIGDKVILQNISGKKSFVGTNEKEIKVHFERNGKESFLLINDKK